MKTTYRASAMLALAATVTPLAAPQAIAEAPRPAAAPLEDARPICKGAEGYAAAFGGRRTFLWQPDVMMRLKAAKDSDPQIKAAYDALIAKAHIAMTHPLYTVVDKTTVPYSGDRHDYLSTVANWFRDPANPQGPYIRGEGSNPERLSDKFDIADLEKMSADVELLSLAYYFSDNPRYATRAASLVRTWFLNPDSRMNPNMNFAQTVIGREKGRPDGLLETARIQRVIEGVGLIGPSGKFTPDEVKGLEKWFSDYVDWMRTSPHGRAASELKSFTSLWYDSQMAQFALFARRPEIVKAVVEAYPKRRFAVQFTADGKLPVEMARSRSLGSTIYALTPVFNVTELGRCVGVDLWKLEDGGRSLKRSTDFLAGYYGKVDTWPYPEPNKNPNELNELLHRANRVAGDSYPATPRADVVRYMRASWQ